MKKLLSITIAVMAVFFMGGKPNKNRGEDMLRYRSTQSSSWSAKLYREIRRKVPE